VACDRAQAALAGKGWKGLGPGSIDQAQPALAGNSVGEEQKRHARKNLVHLCLASGSIDHAPAAPAGSDWAGFGPDLVDKAQMVLAGDWAERAPKILAEKGWVHPSSGAHSIDQARLALAGKGSNPTDQAQPALADNSLGTVDLTGA